MSILTVNGITLPDIPDGVVQNYPYLTIGGINGQQYILLCSDTVCTAFRLSQLGYDYDMAGVFTGNVYLYKANANDSVWTFISSGTASPEETVLPIGTVNSITYTLEWTNHNVPVGELDSNGEPTGNVTGEIYFYSMVSLEIPQWVLNSYPYIAKYVMSTDYSEDFESLGFADSSIEMFIAATSPLLFYDSKVTHAESGYVTGIADALGYSCHDGLGIKEVSIVNTSTTYYTMTQEITWSNHNIMVAEADTEGNLTATDEVYFSGEGLVLPPEEYGVPIGDIRRIAYNVRRITKEYSGYTVDRLGPALDDIPEKYSIINSGATKWKAINNTGEWPHFARNICYANGLWVAYVNDGGLYYSSDFKTWTASNITANVNGLFGCMDGLWIAKQYVLGSGTTILTSKDGKTWDSVVSPISIETVYYELGFWIVAGTSVYYSVDNGQTWTQVSSGVTNKIVSLAYAKGVWVAGTGFADRAGTYGLWYSEDGKNWTMVEGTSGKGFGVIVYENGLWLASDDETSFGTSIYYSEDGKTWTQGTGTTGRFNNIKYANGVYVATSETIGTQTAMGYQGGVFYSEDGKTWTKAVAKSAYALEFAHGVWVAALADGLYSSYDGKSWEKSDHSSLCRWVKNVNGLWLARYITEDSGMYLFSPSFILPV